MKKSKRCVPAESFLVMCAYVLFGSAGCEAATRESVVVADSAGVRITISSRASSSVVLDPEPLLSLGGIDGSGPTQFFNIRGIHVDPDQDIWVADGGSNEIRIFRPDGTLSKTLGGQGQGPGEFQRIRLLGAFRGDSIAFWDDTNARLAVYDREGELSRTANVGVGNGLPPQPFDIYADGTLLVRVRREALASSLAPGQVLSDSAHFARLDSTGRQRPLGSTPGARWVWTGRNQIPMPFTSNPAFDLDHESLLVASESAFRIQLFKNGWLEEIYGVERAEREVTADEVDAYTGLINQAVPDTMLRVEYLSVLEHPDRPSRLPAYSRIVVSSGGGSWAQVYSANPLDAAVWDVFNEDRVWLGEAETPAGFMIEVIADEKIYGVWRDALGVEHVRVYSFRIGQ